MAGGRFMEIIKHYGKVGLGVHISVSMASTAGLYVAVKTNMNMEPLLDKIGSIPCYRREYIIDDVPEFRTPPEEEEEEVKFKNWTAGLTANGGGALAFAIVINKLLFPDRAPATVAITPLVVRFLARRRRFV